MKPLTRQDLERIRNRERGSRNPKNQKQVRITVHLGTCGIASGAEEVLAALKKAIDKNRIDSVRLCTSGCAGLCSREPMVTVQHPGNSPVRYADVTPGKALEILEKDAIQGIALKEYALFRGNETIA